MHVLLTTDSVGGVWTYTAELTAGLLRGGHQITLMTLGRRFDPAQRFWVESMRSPRFLCVETEFRLEWMDDAGEDLRRSDELLRELVRKGQPDLLHTNQFAYGELADILPVLLTGHSDVLSWWEAVYGERVSDTGRLRAYTALVRAGLQAATRLAAPTAWMAREMREQYGVNRQVEVIPNGRTPELFDSGCEKVLQAVTVGRAWDPGKNVQILEQINVPMPLWIAGEAAMPSPSGHVADVEEAANVKGVGYLGRQDAAQLRELYSRTAIYVATSLYEPFGLAPLEGALSGCALVLSDLPTLREIWDGAAIFYPAGDAHALEHVLRRLADDPVPVKDAAGRALARARSRYGARDMVRRHEAVYSSLAQVAAP